MDTSFISITAVAFQIGSLSVRWYGIIISLGMALGIYLAYREVKREHQDPDLSLIHIQMCIRDSYFDLVSEEEVLSLLDQKRPDQELRLTGRSATAVIIARADLVTEMKEIKHPYQKGISARRGIEY